MTIACAYSGHVLIFCTCVGAAAMNHTLMDDLMYLENIREYVEDHKTIVSFLSYCSTTVLPDDFAGNL